MNGLLIVKDEELNTLKNEIDRLRDVLKNSHIEKENEITLLHNKLQKTQALLSQKEGQKDGGQAFLKQETDALRAENLKLKQV